MTAVSVPVTGDGDLPGRGADVLVAPARAQTTARRRRRQGRVGLWLAVGWVVVIVTAALLADVLPLRAYDEFTSQRPGTGPGLRWPEPLGSDAVGRSVLSRLVHGARQSLQISLVSVAVAVSVGSLLGLLAGYLRGRIDAVLAVVFDSLLAFPPLVLLLAISAMGARSQATLIVGLALLAVAPFARLVRANTLALAEREFVLAARAMGATRRRIMFLEIFPNVVPALVSVVFLFVAGVMVFEGSLSFLGLGVPPPHPSWGGMVNEGRAFLNQDPALVLVPAGVLLVTVMSFRRIGEEVRVRLVGGTR